MKCSGCGICVKGCPGHALSTEGEYMSAEEVLEKCLQDIPLYEESGGGVTISGGEILSSPCFAEALISLLHENGLEVLPRIPVIPGFNDSPDDARGMSVRLREVGLSRAQLLPFHQFGENKYHLLNKTYAYENVPSLHPDIHINSQKTPRKNGRSFTLPWEFSIRLFIIG